MPRTGRDDRKTKARVRRVKPDDLDVLCEIEQRCFPGEIAYTRKQIKHLALIGNTVCLVDDPGEGVRGFVVATFRDGTKVAGIETIDVHPKHRGKGVGKALLTAAEREMKRKGARKARLEVSEGNRVAKTLYQKVGYVPVERVENYYNFEHEGSRNALRMEKALV